MRIGFIGDIVGKPGRKMVKYHLPTIRKELELDYVIANYENASHGFGLTPKNANELLNAGIDLLTGGNHTWDKREIIPLLESDLPILRPFNYPDGVPGRGYALLDGRLAVINLMGQYGMPPVENPFIRGREIVQKLRGEGISNIFIDFHAEATSEKRALFLMLRESITALVGTHTHIGTDDLTIVGGAGYLTDIGLTGCRDNVIGMKEDVPIQRFLTGLPGHFDIPDRCRAILQMVIFQMEDGVCREAFKIKAYDRTPYQIVQRAYIEE
ncbi:MAG: YmdB family metallophosphoesterase [Epsilonproteobacteria bacterium]|nr:metallophosphoesterase [Campylobacterota bacterium]NPA56747.1 YmdB family metallophosphoesterase [Campylobacterota bacterium]